MMDKELTVKKMVEQIYDANYSHIDFIDNMNGGDCDCGLHKALAVILPYLNKQP